MFQADRAGKTISERTALEKMSRWDEMEQTVALGSLSGASLDLTAGTLGDSSGTGSGKNRSNYCCYGIHNPNSTAVTVIHTNAKAGASKNFTLYIPAGGWAMPLIQVTSIIKSGSTNSIITLLYKDKYAMEESGPVQGITE